MFPLKQLYPVSILAGLGFITFTVAVSQATTHQSLIPVGFRSSNATSSIWGNPKTGVAPQPTHNNTLIAQKQSKIALVIGNADYDENALANPVNDATDMAKALQKLGFEVTLLKNQDLRTMETAIDDFSLKLRQGGVGLFYYAGHGVQVEGENYLIPLKAKLLHEKNARYEALALGKVINAMQAAETQVNIVIIDACRDNPFYRRWRSSRRGSSVRGLAQEIPPEGTVIAFATAPGEYAQDGKGRNSPFTSHLLRYIKEPNLDVVLMFRRVRAEVLRETDRKQEPWYQESLVGSFSFNSVDNSPSPQPNPTPVVTIPTPKPSPSPTVAAVPKPKPPPSTPSSQQRSTLISSTTGTDYTPLRELLAQKKWKEADQTTWDLMLAAAKRQKEERLDYKSIKKFSCEDLRMIDQEWLKASGGKFGFSVQLRIFKQTGNTPGSYNDETYRRFGDEVGWRKNGSWQDYPDLSWSTNAQLVAPQGHLPTAEYTRGVVAWVSGHDLSGGFLSPSVGGFIFSQCGL
ncbi:caspase family protein [Crocosphaera sp. XPORK-15E]|uniref:caspase family protein n=1 Tax=Crocosphaera sp. XPORK-15E TaxID=3110247 RepID=UPI002B20038E|nr:caspase family protein [Crocosphaera sp. XPORK-15E]MEA5534325.1 caspase family protein [Crocosphaera sp. XPORK-15E]